MSGKYEKYFICEREWMMMMMMLMIYRNAIGIGNGFSFKAIAKTLLIINLACTHSITAWQNEIKISLFVLYSFSFTSSYSIFN